MNKTLEEKQGVAQERFTDERNRREKAEESLEKSEKKKPTKNTDSRGTT